MVWFLQLPNLQAGVHHLCSNMSLRVAVMARKNEIASEQSGRNRDRVAKLIAKPASGDISLLIVILILNSFVPNIFAAFGVRSLFIGLACAFINLALCVAGYLTGRFRIFWGLWALSSVIVLILFGMVNPLGAVMVLWKI